MVLSDRCAAALVIPVAVWASACGPDRAGAAAQAAQPPTVFERLGWAPSALPVRWVEAPDADGIVREYYEDILGYEGEELDVAVRGHLVITQQGQPRTRQYTLTEYRLAGNVLSAGRSACAPAMSSWLDSRGAIGRVLGRCSPRPPAHN